MIVTGMFVADVARASEGKLNVLGGVQDWIRTNVIGTEHPLPITLVVLVQRDAADDAEHGAITMEAFGPSGDQLGSADLSHTFPAGSENGFVFIEIGVLVSEAGRYTFVGTANGSAHSAAIGLRILAAEPT